MIVIGLLAGCTRQKPASAEHLKMAIVVAEQFGQAIVSSDFEVAHSFLTESAQRIHSAAALKAEVTDMIAYAKEPLQRAVLVKEVTMQEWPDREPDDVAWMYVSLEGVSYSEGVSLVLTSTGKGVGIRELEWGRP